MIALLTAMALAAPSTNLGDIAPPAAQLSGTFTGDAHFPDTVELTFGNTAAAPDAWWVFDGTNFDLISTDIDGGGTDGELLRFVTGEPYMYFGTAAQGLRFDASTDATLALTDESGGAIKLQLGTGGSVYFTSAAIRSVDGSGLSFVAAGSTQMSLDNGGFQFSDSVELQLGSSFNGDYALVHENSPARLELKSADTDGASTAGNVFTVDDGTDDVEFYGAHHQFAEGYIDAGSQTVGVAAAGQNVWVEVNGVTSGDLRNWTQSAGDFTCGFTGTYAVTYSISFSGSASQEYEAGVSIDDVIQSGCRLSRVIGSGGDIGSAGSTCILSVTSAEVLKIEMRGTAGTPGDATVTEIAITIHQL